MKTINFAKRNFKEIVRDPLCAIFSILLPLFLLYIFQQFDIPNDAFNIENFTPGIVIFSFSFITLFTATLIAKDRSSSFLTRLCASPMKSSQYIMGYILAILPITILQSTLFFIVALFLGLPASIHSIFAILVSIPISILFINLGIIIGCITSDKAAPGVSSVIVQLVAFTSGMYFPTDMIGGAFAIVCNLLPFSRSVDITKGILNGNYENLVMPISILAMYILGSIILASILFKKKLGTDNT